MKYFPNSIFLLLFALALCLSCVEDTDFDQADDIQFTPEVELNLIYFNLEANDFFDETTQTSRLVVKDTTALEFLEGGDLSETLKRMDFTFNFSNTIAREFQVDFEFSKLNGEVTYITGTTVQASDNGEEVISVFEETVDEANVQNITNSGQVIVTVTIPSADASLQGALNLTSKTIYYLEY